MVLAIAKTIQVNYYRKLQLQSYTLQQIVLSNNAAQQIIVNFMVIYCAALLPADQAYTIKS